MLMEATATRGLGAVAQSFPHSKSAVACRAAAYTPPSTRPNWHRRAAKRTLCVLASRRKNTSKSMQVALGPGGSAGLSGGFAGCVVCAEAWILHALAQYSDENPTTRGKKHLSAPNCCCATK